MITVVDQPGPELNPEQQAYLVKEFLALQRRRLIGALVATPGITAVVLLFLDLNMGWDIDAWLWVIVLGIEILLVFPAYRLGMWGLRRVAELKYNLDG